MLPHALNRLLALSLSITAISAASSSSSTSSSAENSGYVGYNLTLEGDQDSVIYSTSNTRQNASTAYPSPDVFLNASVSVKTIDINVNNLTAKVNLDLQVLELLQFNAGVDLSIQSVRLLIQDVKAKVLLEARLQNLVEMVDHVLESLDLNPVLASLGQGVGNIIDETTDAVNNLSSNDDNNATTTTTTPTEKMKKRSFLDLKDNILYAINDFSGNSHTNRILSQNGNIIEQDLDNNGHVSATRVVGSYTTDMTFVTGSQDVVDRDGKKVTRKLYRYEPIHGVQAVSEVFFDDAGAVVATGILSEFEVGGFAAVEADA